MVVQNHLEDPLQQTEAHHRILYQAACMLLDTVDRQETLATVCRISIDLLDVDKVWIGLQVEGQIRPAAALGFTGLTVSDGTDYEQWHDYASANGCQSYMTLPLYRADETVLGMLCMYSKEPQFFTQGHLPLCQAFVPAVAKALARVTRHPDETAERLALACQQLDAVLETTTDQVLLTDAEGRIERVNGAFKEQTQHSDMVGQHITTIISQGDYLEKPWRGQASIMTAAAEPITVDMSITPIKDRSGAAAGYVVVADDTRLTDEVQALRSEFIQNVSHELRTPLTSVKLYASLLGEKPDRLECYLPPIMRELSRLELAVDSLLLRADIERKQITVDPEVVDLEDMLTGIITDRQALAAHKGIDLRLSTNGHRHFIVADKELAEQIIELLITDSVLNAHTGEKLAVAVQTTGDLAGVCIAGPARQSVNKLIGPRMEAVECIIHRHGGRLESSPGSHTIWFRAWGSKEHR